MANRQIEQAKVDVDAALLLIQDGHLEPAQELLRFARAELDDALAILAGGAAKEPNDHQPIEDGSRARQHS